MAAPSIAYFGSFVAKVDAIELFDERVRKSSVKVNCTVSLSSARTSIIECEHYFRVVSGASHNVEEEQPVILRTAPKLLVEASTSLNGGMLEGGGAQEFTADGAMYAPFAVLRHAYPTEEREQAIAKGKPTANATEELEAARKEMKVALGGGNEVAKPSLSSGGQSNIKPSAPAPPQIVVSVKCQLLVMKDASVVKQIPICYTSFPVLDLNEWSSKDCSFDVPIYSQDVEAAVQQLLLSGSAASDGETEDARGPTVNGVAGHVRCRARMYDLGSRLYQIVQSAKDAEDEINNSKGPDGSRAVLTCEFSDGGSQQQLLPYGCMPLFVLYDHYVNFFRVHTQKHVRANQHVRKLLGLISNGSSRPSSAASAVTKECVVVEPLPSGCTAPLAWRWELLSQLDCSQLILGDQGFAPLAATIRSARGIRRINLSGNLLSFVSARRLVAAVKDHPSLQELYIEGNQFFESAGEEILRLLKISPPKGRARVYMLDIARNAFSERLQQRFVALSSVVMQQLDDDPFFAFSTKFDYLSSGGMDAIPTATWKAVEPIWRMLTVLPPAPPLVNIPSITDGKINAGALSSLAISVDGGAMMSGARIPIVATAPLLSNVMRNVHFEICREVQDPIIRTLFCEISTGGSSGSGAAADASDCSGVGTGHQKKLADGRIGEASFTLPTDIDAMYLQSFVKMIVTVLRVALDAPSHWDDCVGIIRSIGAQHERVGVRPWLYCRANRFFVDALESHFPAEDFTADVKASFVQILALVTRFTASGMTCVA